MPPISDEAIILQAFPYSETSLIVRLLTHRHGVRSAIAKGARRTKNRAGAGLDVFGEGVVTLYMKEGRDLQTLGGFDLTRSRRGLGRHLLRFGAASLLAELVMRTASEERDPGLFAHIQHGLGRLETCDVGGLESVALAEAWALVGRLGFAPAMDACLHCGRVLTEGEDAVFDYRAGGIRCRDCGTGEAGRVVPAHARHALAGLVRGEAVALERTAAHWQLLGRFLTYHVVDGKPLRSLEFLAHALETS